MKRLTGPFFLTSLTAAALFAGCSDDPPAQSFPTAGSSGSTTAGTNTAGTNAGSAGASTAGGTDGGSSGSGGATGGTAGATAGGGAGGTTAGTAGTGGTPEPIVPTIVLIDNVRLQLKPGYTEGAGGAGGAGGADGAGGSPDLGTGGVPDVGIGGVPGLGGESSLGGEGGGDAGPVDDPPWPAGDLGINGFFHEFTADVMPFAFNTNGFSPGPGMSEGPAIIDTSTLTHVANMGRPGGAVQLAVPFTVRRQQADIAGMFPAVADLTHYELVAEVKLVSAAYGAECTSAWMYVYGGGAYANDASGEPAQYTTGHLVEGVWKTVRLDLDGPYGFHSSATFTPATVQVWGLQLNTWGCP